MAILAFAGIDVSKDRLDVMVLPEEHCSSVSNDAAGWAELIEQRSLEFRRLLDRKVANFGSLQNTVDVKAALRWSSGACTA